MKRMHVHISVPDLAQSVRFYAALFAAAPTVQKPGYAKWMLEDPRLNFALTQRGDTKGVQHLGIQVENESELAEVYGRLAAADAPVVEEKAVNCCYAKSDKHWIKDPQGIAWEMFHTYGESAHCGGSSPLVPVQDSASCCAPKTAADGGCCAA